MRMAELIRAEGIIDRDLPAGVLKGDHLLNGGIFLFGWIPEDSDPRWAIVDGYVQARTNTRFRHVTFETALSAIYLSPDLSYRSGYSQWGSTENVRQLCRAVVNIGSYPLIRVLYERAVQTMTLPAPFDIELALTDRILRGSNAKGITGCPEAVYQVRLFYEGRYEGRVGFNTHLERDKRVVSITNIQGIPGGSKYYQSMEREGIRPFNYLVGVVKAMTEQGPNEIELRGLKNPNREAARPLYNQVLRKEQIKRVSFDRYARVFDH